MRVLKKQIVFTTRVFKVEEVAFEREGRPLDHMYHRFLCPHWVNVLPITIDNQALMIRQFRAGALKDVLEIPGGMVDPGEKDPTMAAVRELEEETGFTTQRVLSLGSVNPNPALQDNRVHFFLALGCAPNPNRAHFPDAEEDIQIELHPVNTLDELVRTGRVDHALSSLCIMLAGKYVDIGSPKTGSGG